MGVCFHLPDPNFYAGCPRMQDHLPILRRVGRELMPSIRSSTGILCHASGRVKKVRAGLLLKSVTHPFYGLDIVVSQFLPDLSYVNIHSAVDHVNIITPYLVQ